MTLFCVRWHVNIIAYWYIEIRSAFFLVNNRERYMVGSELSWDGFNYVSKSSAMSGGRCSSGLVFGCGDMATTMRSLISIIRWNKSDIVSSWDVFLVWFSWNRLANLVLDSAPYSLVILFGKGVASTIYLPCSKLQSFFRQEIVLHFLPYLDHFCHKCCICMCSG